MDYPKLTLKELEDARHNNDLAAGIAAINKKLLKDGKKVKYVTREAALRDGEKFYYPKSFCSRDKHVSAHYANSGKCQQCSILDFKFKRSLNINSKNRSYREKELYNRLKNNAKKRGIEFDLLFESIFFPDACPVLGIKLNYFATRKDSRDFSPSFDRVDNSLGYITGNIRVISTAANRMKSDHNKYTLQQVSKYIEDHENNNLVT